MYSYLLHTMENVTSREQLLNLIGDGDSDRPSLSTLLLFGSWNNINTLFSNENEKDNENETPASNSIVKSLQLCIKRLNVPSHYQVHNLCLQADFNDDTIDFCIGDQTQTGRPDADEDVIMSMSMSPTETKTEFKTEAETINSHDKLTNNYRLKAPGELPALFVLHSFRGKLQYFHVSIDSKDLLVPSMLNHAVESVISSSITFVPQPQSQPQPQQPPGVENKKRGRNGVYEKMSDAHSKSGQIRIFIAGDRSQVGKSSVCLGLLGSFLRMGYPASSVAYIKPATQCEEAQLVTEYCKNQGIDYCPVGPIVYYRGFTRAFLNGETESANELLAKVSAAVDSLAKDKAVVVIDGVGYPAVGSITNTDNSAVAMASGYVRNLKHENKNVNVNVGSGSRIPPAVLIVGKRGVGDAIDSYNMNATYFRSNHVPVIGGIFNRLPADGYYSLENCKRPITAYFDKQFKCDDQTVFGFIPELEAIADSRDTDDAALKLKLALEHAETFIDAFVNNVDVAGILCQATNLRDRLERTGNDVENNMEIDTPIPKKVKLLENRNNTKSQEKHTSIGNVLSSRERIENAAKAAGAAAG